MDPAMREIIWVGFFLGAGVEAAKGTVEVELDMVGEVFLVGLCLGWDMGFGVCEQRGCDVGVASSWFDRRCLHG